MNKKQDLILKHGRRFFEYAVKHWNNTTKPDMIHWENLVACKLFLETQDLLLTDEEKIYRLVNKEINKRIKNHIEHLDSYDKKNPMTL